MWKSVRQRTGLGSVAASRWCRYLWNWGNLGKVVAVLPKPGSWGNNQADLLANYKKELPHGELLVSFGNASWTDMVTDHFGHRMSQNTFWWTSVLPSLHGCLHVKGSRFNRVHLWVNFINQHYLCMLSWRRGELLSNIKELKYSTVSFFFLLLLSKTFLEDVYACKA